MTTPTYLPHKAELEKRPDGAYIFRSAYPMSDVADTTGDWLHRWAGETPDRVFLAERFGAGWRTVTYAQALEMVQAIGASLLGRGLGPDRPIIVMSGNGVDHGLLALAGQYVGVPTVPVAEQYSLIHGAHGRLRHAIEAVTPGMAYVVDADQYGEALKLDALEGIEVVASRPGHNTGVTTFAELLRGDGGIDVAAAHAATGPDTVGKILMTSGSTSAPKGVPTTNRMMCANQTQMADSLPFVRETPPVLCDWLPWNHVFGGSHNFNLVLANGGTLYIDDGKPVPSLIGRTLENLSMIAPTLSFNVPVGFAGILEAMKTDESLRRNYFKNLDLIFYAGASLPQDVWTGLEDMAREVRGEVPLMTSSWGLTETAPACVMGHDRLTKSGVIGVPVTGVEVKLIPDDEMRCEIRVRGPNIMKGYLNDPEKTKAAFDDEGFFITGDAVKFVDPEDVNKGLQFDGRISEDFKLLTGTWVRAAQLRLDVLATMGDFANDLVITGADRNEIGVMIFPNMAELKKMGYSNEAKDGVLTDERFKSGIARRLAERARNVQGSSTKVTRAIVLSEPPSLADGEVTAKGNLNARKILTLRKDLLDRLYDDNDPATIKI